MDTGAVVRQVKRIDAWSRRQPGIGFVRRLLDKGSKDRAGDLAAVIAFFGFFSIFPLLLALGTTVGLVFADDPELQERAVDAVTRQFPDSPQLQEAVGSVPGSGWGLAIGILGSLWGGLGVVNATRTAFDQVWEVPREAQAGLVRSRLLGITTLVLAGAALLGSVVVSSVLPGLGGAIGTVVLSLVTFGIVFVVLSPRGVGWRDVVPGVALATVAWLILQAAGSALIRHQLGQVNAAAGVFSTSLVLLAWMAIQARIVVLAAEVDVLRWRATHGTAPPGVVTAAESEPSTTDESEQPMTPDPDPDTTPSDATRQADERDSEVRGHADRPPTDDEARIAEAQGAPGDEVAEHYEEMAEIGAEVRGEGQIEP
jgi:uncharacterized BrkB/YihY/UPF0761 family membrane protein